MTRRVSPGRAYKLRGQTINDLSAAAETVRRMDNRSGGGPVSVGGNYPWILVRNDTASVVARNGLLAIGEPVITPASNEQEFLQRILLKGIAPTASSFVAVALDPIPAGGIGRCMPPGFIVQAKISKPANTNYAYARAASATQFNAVNEADLADTDRPFQVVWHATGTGVQWAVLLSPAGRRSGLSFLGPCQTYTPAAGLPDSNFEIDWNGCLGPNRIAMFNLNGVAVPLTLLDPEEPEEEPEEDDPPPPLIFESDSFSHTCASGNKSFYARLTVTNTEAKGVLLEIFDVSTDVLQAKAINAIYAVNPLVGFSLQFQWAIHSCARWPYDICFAPPSR